MDFAAIIREAWALTWRHRFLWLLAIFAGTPLATCGNLPTSQRPARRNASSISTDDVSLDRAWDDFGGWIADHPALVAGFVLAIILVGLVLITISLTAQGAMSRATLDLAAGRPVTLGGAWRSGRLLFWRYARLTLLLLTVNVPIGILSSGAAAAITFGDVAGASRTLLGLLAIAAFLVSIPLGIIVAFAQRTLAAQSIGARSSLRAGWEILRANLGTSLLAWLVCFALTIAGAIGLIVALLIAVIPLAIIGAVIDSFASGGVIVASIIVGAALITVAFVVLLAAGSTFTWHFWTLVYLRARDRLLAAPAP